MKHSANTRLRVTGDRLAVSREVHTGSVTWWPCGPRGRGCSCTAHEGLWTLSRPHRTRQGLFIPASWVGSSHCVGPGGLGGHRPDLGEATRSPASGQGRGAASTLLTGLPALSHPTEEPSQNLKLSLYQINGLYFLCVLNSSTRCFHIHHVTKANDVSLAMLGPFIRELCVLGRMGVYVNYPPLGAEPWDGAMISQEASLNKQLLVSLCYCILISSLPFGGFLIPWNFV